MKRFLVILMYIIIPSTSTADIRYQEMYPPNGFDGCEYGKLINLGDGYVWECTEYNYYYHYGTLTVLEVDSDIVLCIGNIDQAIDEYPNGNCYSGFIRTLQ